MNKDRKLLLAASGVAAAGWLCVAVLVVEIGLSEQRAQNALKVADGWKQQAGRAYTELLKARAGTDSTAALIPAGARIDCTMKMTTVDGRAIAKCEDGTIYPPRDY
ncbi:hypothetical protein LJN26_004281 [Salmonella enterica]|nr:hypothetical protein [Salmonella enterica]EJF2760075.1 hypothetical protein [Salmonella enterica]